MLVRNKATRKQYEWSRAEWNQLGKNQSLFVVIDENDAPGPAAQKVTNNTSTKEQRPDTGEQKNSKRIRIKK